MMWSWMNLRTGNLAFTIPSRPHMAHLEPSMVQMSEALQRFLNDEFIFWFDNGNRYPEVSARFDKIGQSMQWSRRT